MGDLGAVEGNGVGMEERLGINNPDPSTISDDQWAVAEEATEEVINSVHPTLDSEENRKDIIDYVQRLIRFSLGFEVFPYGSVPLRTYLPDGDIDLTVLSNSCAEESWASDVLFVLQAEENNENAEYEVKDTHFIDAEVKLVKCLIQNIVIDISFNQLGGICTLCFLEQVDRIVGKNHLFKRSIILIKTWCYYESRILGAHHGLISTYAMETLVLYIFNLFHSSLNGPLAVLYRFLDYFSKFDWENYCISLNGPVPKYSSLPDIVVEMPKNEADDLMLSKEFMRNSIEIFTIPSRDSETSRAFCPKFLNIIDPLKEYNNLGRSVHRGNFYRIRSAFKYGARKLGQILSLPREEIADEIKTFFSNTLQSLSWKDRSDIHDYALPYGAGGLGAFDPFFPGESFSVDDMLPKSSTGDFENDGLADSLKVFSSQTIAENSYSFDYSAVAGHGLNGDDFDLPAYSSADFRTSNGTSECSPSGNYSGSFLSKSSTENGHFSQSNPSDGVEEKQDLVPLLEDKMYDLGMVNTYTSCDDNWDSFCSFSSAASSPKTSVMESLSLDFRERDSASDIDAEPLNPLADLSGDYDSNIRSLLYGQCCHGYTLSALGLPDSPASLSQLQSKQPWDTAYQSRPLRSLSFSQMNSSAVEQPARITRSNSVFVSEERHRGRGTGTYLPVMNSFGTDRTSQGRMRNKSSGQLQRQTHSNGFVPAFSETNASRRGIREITSACDPGQTRKKSSAIRQSYHPMESDVHSNGYSNSSRRIEFGSLGHLAVVGGSNSSTSSDKPTSASDLIKGEERVTNKSFHLKNEAEFPPLSV